MQSVSLRLAYFSIKVNAVVLALAYLYRKISTMNLLRRVLKQPRKLESVIRLMQALSKDLKLTANKWEKY